jgi:hypothetical protein
MISRAYSPRPVSAEVPHAACPPPRPPIWIYPDCQLCRQCYLLGRAPKIHLRKPNATRLAKQFQSTRATSYCPQTSWRHRTGKIGALEGPVDDIQPGWDRQNSPTGLTNTGHAPAGSRLSNGVTDTRTILTSSPGSSVVHRRRKPMR